MVNKRYNLFAFAASSLFFVFLVSIIIQLFIYLLLTIGIRAIFDLRKDCE